MTTPNHKINSKPTPVPVVVPPIQQLKSPSTSRQKYKKPHSPTSKTHQLSQLELNALCVIRRYRELGADWGKDSGNAEKEKERLKNERVWLKREKKLRKIYNQVIDIVYKLIKNNFGKDVYTGLIQIVNQLLFFYQADIQSTLQVVQKQKQIQKPNKYSIACQQKLHRTGKQIEQDRYFMPKLSFISKNPTQNIIAQKSTKSKRFKNENKQNIILPLTSRMESTQSPEQKVCNSQQYLLPYQYPFPNPLSSIEKSALVSSQQSPVPIQTTLPESQNNSEQINKTSKLQYRVFIYQKLANLYHKILEERLKLNLEVKSVNLRIAKVERAIEEKIREGQMREIICINRTKLANEKDRKNAATCR